MLFVGDVLDKLGLRDIRGPTAAELSAKITFKIRFLNKTIVQISKNIDLYAILENLNFLQFKYRFLAISFNLRKISEFFKIPFF